MHIEVSTDNMVPFTCDESMALLQPVMNALFPDFDVETATQVPAKLKFVNFQEQIVAAVADEQGKPMAAGYVHIGEVEGSGDKVFMIVPIELVDPTMFS